MKRIIEFFNQGIWAFRINSISPHKSLFIRVLRVVVLALKNFIFDQCFLRAAAITFYSMLSVVPVVAVLIGVAKGFGYEKMLRQYLLQRFGEQEEVINQVFFFADSMLESSRGGMVAGFGVLLLFWSVIKLIGHIESSFNYIWRIRCNRPFMDKASSYMVLMVVAPFAIIVSSSANVFISTRLSQMIENYEVLQPFGSPLISLYIHLLPYFLIWTLFAFIYKFMPNTKVALGSAIIGALIGGTLFQCLQEFYIVIQVWMFAKYKAIYGSFSTLPLFLMWLQLTWLIVLFGAEVAFAHQNSKNFELEVFSDKISPRALKAYTVRIVAMLVDNFINHRPPLIINEISVRGGISIGLARKIINTLIDAEIIYEVRDRGGDDMVYQPACDVAELTIFELIERIDNLGMDKIVGNDVTFDRISSIVATLAARGNSASENISIRDLRL